MRPFPSEQPPSFLRRNWPELASVAFVIAMLIMLLLMSRPAHAQVTTQPAPKPLWPTARALRTVSLPLGPVNVTSVRSALTADPGTNTPSDPRDDTPNDPSDDFILGGTIYVPGQVGTSCVIDGAKLDLSGGMQLQVYGDGDQSIIYLLNGAWIDISGSQVVFRNLRIMQDHTRVAIFGCRGTNKDGTPKTASVNRCALDNVRIDSADGTGSSVGSVLLYGMEHFSIVRSHIENKMPGGHAIILDSAYLPQFGYSAAAVGYTNSAITIEKTFLCVRGGTGAEKCLLLGDQTTDVTFDGWMCTSGPIDSLVTVRGDTPLFGRSRRPSDIELNIIPECSPEPPVTVRFTGTSKFSDVKVIGGYASKVLDGFERGYPTRTPATN
jgi:hypothetical protein